ncbi:hypothetical protein KIN20_010479 [Parelaphostrongylus tenuis]|uniref:Major facilitator superfamily (MFS) profile domain-containing protein n=1 Tax=Parelaphostrongylus tenuis TaxID=148309 RepID=A0AAD5M7X6_PARTN|nr:hypothetical protein KIN20_010479 [Parelaphostrongylus tenuis]
MSEKKQHHEIPFSEGEEDLDDIPPAKSVDDFLKMGNYCYLILLTSEFLLLCAAGNMIYMMFAGSAPKVSCHGSNGTIQNVCDRYMNLSDLIDCKLELQYEFKSVNVEFDYLCDEGRWVKSSISVQMLGVLVGTLFLGTLSDRFGRKPTLVASFVTTSLIGIASSFSTSLLSFTILRTILGFFNGGILGVYGVYKMEHIPKQHRFWVSTVIAWAPNFMILTAIAYVSYDWRTFQRLLVVVSSPALIMFFFVCESPRWLIQKGRIADARKVLQHIQHVDRQKETKKEAMQEMLDITHQKLVERNEKAKSYNIRHLFYGKEMSLATITFCSGQFMTSMINYGLTFNIELLSGSFFINSATLGAVRWLINIAFAVLDFNSELAGRKLVHFISQSSIAVCLGAITAVYLLDLRKDLSNLIRISTILATATTSQTFITKSITAMEYYPTMVRNSGLALKSTCSRFGTIVAPQLFILSSWGAFPYVVLTAMAVFDTLVYQIVIPETKGKALPENMPVKRKKIMEPLI